MLKQYGKKHRKQSGTVFNDDEEDDTLLFILFTLKIEP